MTLVTPEISYSYSPSGTTYIPPFVLPLIDNYRHFDDKRAYAEAELVKAAEDKSLYLTDYLAQKGFKRDLVGLILKGLTIDSETKNMVRALDGENPILSTYRVKIQCIDGRSQTIRYKNAVVADPYLVELRANLRLDLGNGEKTTYRKMVPRIVDYKAKEADILAPEAWICLSSYGEYCRSAKNQRQQNQLWLFREAKPKNYAVKK